MAVAKQVAHVSAEQLDVIAKVCPSSRLLSPRKGKSGDSWNNEPTLPRRSARLTFAQVKVQEGDALRYYWGLATAIKIPNASK